MFNLCAFICLAPQLALAQAPAPYSAPETETIVVRAAKPAFTARSTITPELTLEEADVAAYGVSTLGELVEALAPETSSGRGRGGGRPVVLLNGRRPASFREIWRYPFEVIERVDILPEEVSLSYGFPADQRVINIVLKPDITVAALETELEFPEEGGTNTVEGSGQVIYLDGLTRLSLDGEISRRTPLFEVERDISFDDGVQDAALRTLLSEQRVYEAGFSAATGLWGDITGSVNAAFERVIDDDARGEDVTQPGIALAQRSQQDDTTIGLSLLRGLAPITWTLTASANIVKTDTATAFNQSPTGAAAQRVLRETSVRQETLGADLVVNTKLADLSAGPLSLTGQIGFETLRQRASALENDVETRVRLSRDILSARFSLDAPLKLPGVLPGEVTLNGNAQVEDVSDFGALVTYGYGLTWQVFKRLRIIVSTTREEGAPSLNALGDPILITPDIRIFDFAVGRDVFVQTIMGGNPDLTSDQRRVIKLGVQFEPLKKTALRVNVDYTRSRINNETRTFSLLTPEFEAAFPGRVIRDNSGALLSFDRRPVLTQETRTDELRTALNWTKRLGRSSSYSRFTPGPKQPKQDDRRTKAERKKPTGGRIRVSLYHRYILKDEVTIAPGIAPFDFLNGSAAGTFGGTPRHELDLSIRRYKAGFGFGANLNYQTGTNIAAPDGRLSFSGLLQSNVRVTYNLNAAPNIVDALPILSDTRLRFEILNIFNDKIAVRDASGATPLAFQEDILDPVGRAWRFEVRKRF